MGLLGELFVKVGADTKGLKTGLQGAEKQVGGFSNAIQKHHRAIGMAMTAAGGAILAMGALSIKTYAQMGDEVAKMAKRTGFSTEALSELRHAAELSGASLAGIEKGSRTLSGAITDAGFGLETYVRAFASIGLAYKDLAKLTPEEQFLKVMEALAGVEDATLRAAIAADIMGRSGTAMLPMLADGTEGLKEMREEAHKLGIVFDEEAAVKAEEMTDAMTRVQQATSGLKMAIADKLIPALMPLIDKITNVVSNISAWMKENPQLTKMITLTTMAIGGLLVVLGPVVIFLPQIAAGIKMVGVALHTAMGPIGLIIAAIGFLAIAWMTNMGNIRGVTEKVVEAIVHAFGWIWDKIMGFAEQITKAITWVMKQIAHFVNVFSHDWAMAIWNAAEKMTSAVSNFRDKSVSALSDFDISFQKTAKSAQESGEIINEVFDANTQKMDEFLAKQKEVEAQTERVTAAMLGYADKQVTSMTELTRLQDYAIKQGITFAQALQKFGYAAYVGPTGYPTVPTVAGLFARGLPSSEIAKIMGLQHGGIVTSPTVAMVGEKGAEAVIPLEKGGLGMNLTINFAEPVFMEREESIGKLADRIYRKIKQSQRFTFGKSYAGG